MLQRIFAVLFFVWAVASAQTSPSKVLVATGKQVQVQLMSPGTWACEGGQVTTSGPPFCSPGTTKVSFSYMSSRYSMQDIVGSAADLLTGENITAVHGVFDGSYFGYMWGHFEWTVAGAGGKWQGSFTATADQAKGFLVNKAVGYGSGGKLEGLKLGVRPDIAGCWASASMVCPSHYQVIRPMGKLEQKNKRIVQRFGEAHANHSLDLLDDLLTVDFVRHCQATPWVQIRSREDFKRFLEQDWQGAPDAKITPIHLLAEGDCVAMFGVLSGTQTGQWGPLPPSGRPFHTDCSAVFRLAGGKIAELWITWDSLTLLTQLGHWPPAEPGRIGT